MDLHSCRELIHFLFFLLDFSLTFNRLTGTNNYGMMNYHNPCFLPFLGNNGGMNGYEYQYGDLNYQYGYVMNGNQYGEIGVSRNNEWNGDVVDNGVVNNGNVTSGDINRNEEGVVNNGYVYSGVVNNGIVSNGDVVNNGNVTSEDINRNELREEGSSRKRKAIISDNEIEDLYQAIENICEICGKKFNERRSLYHHRKNMHILKFDCDMCKRKFIDQQKLNAHKISHTKRLKNQCQLCGSTYLDKQRLKKHYYQKHRDFAEEMVTAPFPIIFINVFNVK